MSNFHSRDISSIKYNYLELPTTVLTIHIHSYTLNPGSQILNGTSNLQFQTIKCPFLPGYRLCLDHCPVTYMYKVIYILGLILSPKAIYFILKSANFGHSNKKLNFITYYTFITNAANSLTPAHIQLFSIIHR